MLLLDTNFLIYAVKYKLIDEIFSLDRKIIIFGKIFEELKKISVKDKNAKIAIQLIKLLKKEKKLSILKTKFKKIKTDDLIVKFAKENKIEVATLDRRLIKRLKNIGCKVIIIRQKKFLTEI